MPSKRFIIRDRTHPVLRRTDGRCVNCGKEVARGRVYCSLPCMYEASRVARRALYKDR